VEDFCGGFVLYNSSAKESLYCKAIYRYLCSFCEVYSTKESLYDGVFCGGFVWRIRFVKESLYDGVIGSSAKRYLEICLCI